MTQAASPDPFAAGQPDAGSVDDWTSFASLAARLVERAAEQGADLTLIDTDFGRWSMGGAAMLAAWHLWTVSHRGCHARLLAADWQPMVQRQGAWVRWHTPWGHRVQCLQIQPEDASQWPGTLVVAHGLCGARIVDERAGRGVWTTDRRQLHDWLHQVDVILQRSMNVTPHATLGL